MNLNLLWNSILIHGFVIGLSQYNCMYLPKGVTCMVFSCFVCSCSRAVLWSVRQACFWQQCSRRMGLGWQEHWAKGVDGTGREIFWIAAGWTRWSCFWCFLCASSAFCVPPVMLFYLMVGQLKTVSQQKNKKNPQNMILVLPVLSPWHTSGSDILSVLVQE